MIVFYKLTDNLSSRKNTFFHIERRAVLKRAQIGLDRKLFDNEQLMIIDTKTTEGLIGKLCFFPVGLSYM